MYLAVFRQKIQLQTMNCMLNLEKPLEEKMGHTLPEIAAGCFIGILVGILIGRM